MSTKKLSEPKEAGDKTKRTLEEKKAKLRALDKKQQTPDSTDAPSSSTTSTKQSALVVVTSDVLIQRIVENPQMWQDVVKLIVKEIAADPSSYGFQGGLSAVKRRLKLMSAEGLKVSHLKWFVATCEMRGHRLVNYAKKNDSSAAEISALNTIWKFKGQKEDNKKRKKDPPGNVSVVAAKVAFSDLFIAFRKEMGPATFGGEKYEGSCPVIYQWLGSLAAMYSPEEDSAPFAAYEKYISDYEDFQSWYLGVREKAAKAQPPNPDYVPPSEEKKLASLNRSRSFYFLALSSFSIKVRRSWSEGKYPKDVDENVKLEKTPVDEVIEIVDERYTQNYKTDSVSQKS